ncbi:MAG: hypothetical protein PHF51_00900 [Candidatus ainarchaeum sp.]|nr:hypothetical protein [Candidatus ainarchaeum sp.]
MDELTYADLAVLGQIDENTTVDNLGPKINSSFFDAANIAGTLKLKGYVELAPSLSATAVTITEKGKSVLKLANEKGAQDLDALDEAILRSIANGYKDPRHLEDKLNVRGSDVAFHIHRVVMQDYASAVIRNGRIELSLTEEGYKKGNLDPLGTEEQVEEAGKEAEELVGDKPAADAPPATAAAAPAKPFRLDRQAMMKAKGEYYFWRALKYAAIGAGVLIIAGVAYFLFFFGK